MSVVAVDTLKTFLILYVEKLFIDQRELKKADEFYLQLARTSRKIIYSQLYKADFQLIKNTLDNNKKETIDALFRLKERDEGKEYMIILKALTTSTSGQIDQRFYAGYRRSLLLTKPVWRLLKYYVLFSFTLCLYSLPYYVIFPDGGDWGTPFKYWFVAFLVHVMVIRWFWRYGPQLVRVRSEITRKGQTLRQSLERPKQDN